MRTLARPVETLLAALSRATGLFGAVLLCLAMAGCVGGPTRDTTIAATQVAANERSAGGAILQLAESMRGKPYRYGGATPSGFDCSGLVFYAHRELGLTVPRTARAQFEAAPMVDIRELRPGDLVFFQLNGRRVDHVGIYAGKGRFIHAPRTGRSVDYDSLQDDYYMSRFAGARRFWQASIAP